MNLRNILFGVTAFVISGCCEYMPSDLMFEVKGEAPQNKECELNLLINDEYVSTTEPIVGKFHTIFYVSFCKRQYTLQASCDGKVVYEKDVIFPSETTEQPLNIGKLHT